MVKFGLALVAVGFAGLATAGQGEIQLGKAVAVDILVRDADWHPDGKTLIYSRTEEKGIGLGIYSLNQFEGKVVVHLEEGETFKAVWLAKSESALVVIATPRPTGTNVRAILVDGATQTAKPVLTQAFEGKDLAMSINASPTLRHAIVTIRNSGETKNFVLGTEKDEMSSAPDIDRVMNEGLRPVWSVDGTAIYTQANAGTEIAPNDTFEFASMRQSRSPVSIPAPAVGANVMELMPTNAVLRPVRFRGAFEPKLRGKPPLIPRNQPVRVQFDRSNAQDNSIWLKRGTESGTPATLVAVHASQVWISPQETAIAYAIDKALYIRTISGG